MFRQIFKFVSLILLFAAGFLAVPAQTTRPVRADFDGDGKSDISVFRRSTGEWYVLKSSGGMQAVQWGAMNDRIVPGDFDGDRKTDFAVYRFGDFMNNSFDSYFYILRSSDNSFVARKWGIANGFTADIPTMPADFDDDGKTDLSVYQAEDFLPAEGRFKISQSLNGATISRSWGYNADWRVPADYDGDGKADIAVFRNSSFFSNEQRGVWYILQSSNNAVRVVRFGSLNDKAVPADYDADGKTDIAVYRPSNGTWYRINSQNNSFYAAQFGATEDKPVPADYDGDGKCDIAVFRPATGVWYLQKSTEGFAAQPFGASGDMPISSAFVVDSAF